MQGLVTTLSRTCKFHGVLSLKLLFGANSSSDVGDGRSLLFWWMVARVLLYRRNCLQEVEDVRGLTVWTLSEAVSAFAH